jgi:hypothetical protein
MSRRAGARRRSQVLAWGRWVALLALLAGLGGCGESVEVLSLPSPPPTAASPAAPIASFPAGMASRVEPTIAGSEPTTTIAIGPGQASLGGTVVGPSGPVGGATVEVSRVVGAASASAMTQSARDGSWHFGQLLGGVYRIRSWLAPSLAQTRGQVVFLGANQDLIVNLSLSLVATAQVTSATNPPQPLQGQPATLGVLVSLPQVSASGQLRQTADAGVAVTLTDGPDWSVLSPNPSITDASGYAYFQITCFLAGPAPLSAQVAGGNPLSLGMPPCGSPPSPPTSGPGCPTTTLLGVPTTTGSATGSPATTSGC